MPHRFIGHRLASLYAQPLEAGIALVLFVTGALATYDEKFTPASISDLSPPWNILFRLLMLLAGVLMFAGLVRGKHRWSFGLEMLGMVLAAVVFLTYAAGLISSMAESGQHGAAMGSLTYAIIAAACVVKVRALWIESGNRLQLIKELPLPGREDPTK
ncbi:hypothetical protein [Arthrobacter sp. 18067]|uniref:hypothetical protein n=1 Tax=Arthrobacter sp. 18067 TaxID=2681413 RepID=UPI001357D2D6|nr:hypothetical protein [Arthrobacter sp. 18067]